MRSRRTALVALGFFTLASGCDGVWSNVAGDCEQTLMCEHFRGLWGIQPPPEGCVPSENADAVDDSCGVFVTANGKDDNSGAKDAPVKTIASAIALAEKNGTRRVYACAETFDEAVNIAASVTIYGGLDCASAWRWVGETTKTTLTAAEGAIPLAMRSSGGETNVRLEDLHVQARSAGMMAKAGMSSIAAVAENISVALARSVLEAGDAADGEAGEAYAMGAPAGADGNPGNEACSADIVNGGLPNKNDCGTPDDPTDDSNGGLGGTGTPDSSSDGSNGRPVTADNGGNGEDTVACTAGTAGDPGTEGAAGAGATGLGEISVTGYTGVAAASGLRGATAQGGGGGGGAKGGNAPNQCTDPTLAGGASGASGGSGGCGGLGGKAGGAAGSSIALVSLNTTLTFDAATLKTGKGGAGGKGGPGQDGGNGGTGGTGGAIPAGATALRAGCSGGSGGTGGRGGSGGGGLGGHAIGIAYKGAAPPVQGATITPGEAGLGGAGTDMDHGGAAGIQAQVQQF